MGRVEVPHYRPARLPVGVVASLAFVLSTAIACQATATNSSPSATGAAPDSTPAVATPHATEAPTPTAPINPSPAPPATSSPSLPAPTVIEHGDAVVAFGSLFESEDPPRALLCPLATGWPGDFGCVGTVFVPVDGVDIFDLPGSEAQPHASSVPESAWITEHVRVEGIWSDGAIEATRVELAERPSVSAYLASLIPGPAETPCESTDGECVEFSERELQDVVDSLTAMKRPWDLYLEAEGINRVVVHVPAFDRSTADAILPYAGKVVVRAIATHAAE